MQLNEVTFGNPNRQHLIYLETENYLDSLFPELSSFQPPANESQDSSEEIATFVPLLVKLKYAYNRPRPYQLANYKKMPLFVWRARSADSPSYPSGHCFQSKIYAEVLGNKYPKYYKALNELANDIMYSRQYMGAHYPSDSEFAIYVAEVVMKHPEFAKKYKL